MIRQHVMLSLFLMHSLQFELVIREKLSFILPRKIKKPDLGGKKLIEISSSCSIVLYTDDSAVELYGMQENIDLQFSFIFLSSQRQINLFIPGVIVFYLARTFYPSAWRSFVSFEHTRNRINQQRLTGFNITFVLYYVTSSTCK